MELKEFISESIKQITDGLVEGDSYVRRNPHSEGINDEYRVVSFDVAVTTNEGEKDKIGGGISVTQIFKAGASAESSNTTSNSSRIKFEITVHISTGKNRLI